MLREWYMHPNGQIPAYEWALAMSTRLSMPGPRGACIRSSKKRGGKGDREFLERVFQKFLLNFTWWVNRKDSEGRIFFKAAFWAWTTSAFSTVAHPCRREVISSRPTARAGWPCTR